MNPVTETLVALAAVAVIVLVGFYASDHLTCFNLLGITKGCVTH
jgi:hypothetical protein